MLGRDIDRTELETVSIFDGLVREIVFRTSLDANENFGRSAKPVLKL
jgi:hypothetical protein